MQDLMSIVDVDSTTTPIERIINTLIKKYGLPPKEIGDAWSWTFAEDLVRELGGPSKTTFVMSTEDLEAEIGRDRMSGLLNFPLHGWVAHNGRFYDAETPKGVDDPLKLNFFERYFKDVT